MSLSPLSDDEDDDEDDKPLAGRVAGSSISRAEKSRPGKRSGKKAPSKKAKKSHTAPTSLAPPVGEKQALMNGKINGVNGHDHKIKLEDKMDETQLSRLAATIDTGRRSPPVVCIYRPYYYFQLYSDESLKKASHKNGKAVSYWATKRRNTDSTCWKWPATAIPYHSHRSKNSFPEATTKNATGIYRASRLRFQFQVIGHH